ncbi:TetR/AcrR family transcriptional regulator [Auraticoccus monumenti]|uniref:DNA-binding transcriptional regulator, AcrR family n=1 Tax=Auraticoccus monumenti TaxID=675864 RepID=A0A1G6TJA6_9ACTN|nr:TetR/AcrR family transcriptional regulator [Auraticoccus monumenti]SDD29150.1 DNA-binding transcriptional regulator, AcrR family [Auraticoccus monumenti]
MSGAPARPLRADARRNREAILRAARATFAAQGIFAPTDRIAAEAGVGNATLYRNFPTREDLLAAVIDESVRDALAASETLERDLPPGAALQEWLFQLVWQLRSWQDLPTGIATAISHDDSPVQDICTRLTARTSQLLERAQRDGAARDVPARSVFELVTAVSWAVDRFADDEERARERVALATAGVFVVGSPEPAAAGHGGG